MENKIIRIELILENCDVIKIDSKYIKGLLLENPVKTQFFFDGSCVLKNDTRYDLIGLYISPEIFKEEGINSMRFSDYKPSSKEMLERRDITSIVIVYEDNTSQRIWFNYWDDVPGMLGADNINQVNILRYKEFENLGVAIGIFDQNNQELTRLFNEMIDFSESYILNSSLQEEQS